MLTPVLEDKVSVHDAVVSCNFAHSLNNGVIGCDALW